MKDTPDLTTLLMAMSFCHVYETFSRYDLEVLLKVDAYKNSLMMVPYNEKATYPKITPEVEHMKRILESHTLAYKELLSRC